MLSRGKRVGPSNEILSNTHIYAALVITMLSSTKMLFYGNIVVEKHCGTDRLIISTFSIINEEYLLGRVAKGCDIQNNLQTVSREQHGSFFPPFPWKLPSSLPLKASLLPFLGSFLPFFRNFFPPFP